MSSKWTKSGLPAKLFASLMIKMICLSTPVLAFNGPHILSSNPCDVCHIPHHAADDMLWARTTTGPFIGVKRLCSSCHGTGIYGAKDRFGIFEPEGDVTFDHVMGGNASVNGPSIIREDWSIFPLKEKEGGDGFYCGSCHDPHRDPYEPVNNRGGGDYLRQEVDDLIKNLMDKETVFCTQCHQGIVFGNAYGHGNEHGCFDCHHPHESPNPGPKILISPLASFTAVPNCQGFTDSEEIAASCYGCHQKESGFKGALGAPLAGDDLSMPMEHHPMGIGADASTAGHQPTPAGPLSPAGELYCGSCHSVHNGANDHYLNPQIIMEFDPANSGAFCIACHSNKSIEDLGPRGEGHHQVSPYNQCIFCHSIHNAPHDPDVLYQTDADEANQFNSSVSVDVIMRILPENLAWSDKILDIDTKDYEDACYGCHARPEIVGREFSLNEENALLMDNVRDKYFSHRFDAIPTSAIKLIGPFDDGLPIVSDGIESKTINDYGIEEGRIWCGSCHNVHRQNIFTTEYSDEYKKRRSAYLREENYGSSFCYRCHTTYHEDLGGRNHPQDKGPNQPVTSSSWEPIYYEGYSGGIGGISNGRTGFDTAQGEVVCQTCHSVHTAKTDWDGGSNEDNLLNHGRLLVKALDDKFCEACHPNVHRSIAGNCTTCHFPHNGIKPFINQSSNFIAEPNVPEISDDPNDSSIILSSFCYACHQARHILDPSDPNHTFWIRNGAAPIYGDRIEGKENDIQKRNHHPMGTQAKLENGNFLHAPGVEATKYLNQNNEITCVSCHYGLHGGSHDHFLRWDFANDNAKFCIQCHNDKVTKNGQIILDGKHFRTVNSPLKRRIFDINGPDYEKSVSCNQCMLCHFIHDGEEREGEGNSGNIRVDIAILMRVEPKNLAWADRYKDTDLNDYEDMCYGCHGDENIIKRPDLGLDALLQPLPYFSHRFASSPDPNNPPYEVISNKDEPVFPLSDGENTAIKNDYGTEPDTIYCGTCHNVHAPYDPQSPYLNSGKSPYMAYDFCEACHDAESSQFKFVHNSHPIDKGPSDLTDPSWDFLYYTGGSGRPGGVTGGPADAAGTVICLTCHNVHAAQTNWQGGISQDPNSDTHGKLLVKDNFSSQEGSDLCRDCHTQL